MKTKHTPGPWAASRFINYPVLKSTVLAPGNEGDENEANARLIAAAPSLLAICETLIRDVEAVGVEEAEEIWPDLIPTYRKAKAAIAKATGGDDGKA